VDLDLTVLRTAHELARYPTGIARPDGEERRQLVGRLREGSEAYLGGFMEGFYLDDAPEFDHWASVEREGGGRGFRWSSTHSPGSFWSAGRLGRRPPSPNAGRPTSRTERQHTGA
jgi:hypothetical protein